MVLNSCPLRGFKLWRDDGAGSGINIPVAFDEYNPTILSQTVTFAVADKSKPFRFILEAITTSG